MKSISQIIIFSILCLSNSCVVQFIPETEEENELLVVEGLITDHPGINVIKLSRSMPLGAESNVKPVAGCIVSISDDLNNNYSLQETEAGIYVTDQAKFRGTIGRWYTLHINLNLAYNNHHYESLPMEMIPVPTIDSIYYEKKTIRERSEISQAAEGCQVYLNTHDPLSFCKFFRWEYSETWEFRLPYSLPANRICWITENSDRINVKTTSGFEEASIKGYPLNCISNETDRLKVKYSILVDQYSLNEDEYYYWEKLQNFTEQVGGLYDIIPASIPSNIWCNEYPDEKVLGYFSVSARSSKRIFIKDVFSGLINLYADCALDTTGCEPPDPALSGRLWLIEDNCSNPWDPYRIYTDIKGCADCTVRGTNIKPSFWKDDK